MTKEMMDACSKQQRSAREVLDDHLEKRQAGRLDEDLALNYSENVVMLTESGVYRGHDGVRHLAETLRRELPGSTYHYRTRLVDGDVGFLEWTARGDGGHIDDGADSYVIRDGRIVAQTIHYTIKPNPAAQSQAQAETARA
jgi:hypothetical protein